MKCEDLEAAASWGVLQDAEASGDALLHRQNPRGDGNVHEEHIGAEKSQLEIKVLLLGNGVCKDESGRGMRTAHAARSSANGPSLPTVGNRNRVQPRRPHDGKEDFVSRVLAPVFSPEQLQHGLDFIRRVVVIILNVALQNKALALACVTNV